MKRVRTIGLLTLILLFAGTVPLLSAEAGLVIRSPLFGPVSRPVVQESELKRQSFADQLGLGGESAQLTDQQRVLSAISSGYYPVTPGDGYRLVYLDGMKTVTVDLQVDEKRNVTIPGLGSIDGSQMSWAQARDAILAMVRTYHSYSNPQLVLTSTGTFTVSVIGEVTGTRVIPAWGLSRLSEVVRSATSWASTREILVTSVDGTARTYDLYKALRKGDLDEDPLLKSGDVITLVRAEKLVQLGGNVYQKGTYQLQEGEGLNALLSYYGGGLLAGSDIQNIRIQRYNESAGGWDVFFANMLDGADVPLQHLDQVIIDTILPSIQSITIEGAVGTSEGADATTATAQMGYASGKIFYQFYPQENLRQLLTTIASRLLTVSDLDGSYLLRGEEKIPIRAQQILYGNDEQGLLRLMAGDTLVIPFNQRFVTVSGGVVRSGIFAYVPEKGVNYYIALAGGLSDDAAYPTSIKLLGSDGKKIDKEGEVPPESTIVVAKNTFVKDLAPTVAVIGLVSSILAIIAGVLSIVLDAKKLWE